jgi:hypothetical protein
MDNLTYFLLSADPYPKQAGPDSFMGSDYESTILLAHLFKFAVCETVSKPPCRI